MTLPKVPPGSGMRINGRTFTKYEDGTWMWESDMPYETPVLYPTIISALDELWWRRGPSKPVCPECGSSDMDEER